MEEWVRRCSLSPLAALLGMLWRGPSRIEEIEAYFQETYNGSPLCWNPKSYQEIIAVLKDYGIIRERDGLLILEKDRLHPVTREIAFRATSLL